MKKINKMTIAFNNIFDDLVNNDEYRNMIREFVQSEAGDHFSSEMKGDTEFIYTGEFELFSEKLTSSTYLDEFRLRCITKLQSTFEDQFFLCHLNDFCDNAQF